MIKSLGQYPNVGVGGFKGRVNLLEPLTPAHTISDRYYLDDETRSEILNSLNTLPKFNKF